MPNATTVRRPKRTNVRFPAFSPYKGRRPKRSMSRAPRPHQTPSPSTEDSEEGRAFLQKRVATFWKVIFFIILSSSVLGAFGAVAKPGLELLLTLASTANAGLFWLLCRTGQRSVRFSRGVESGGLLGNALTGALIGRFMLVGFAREQGILDTSGMVIADGFVTMLEL